MRLRLLGLVMVLTLFAPLPVSAREKDSLDALVGDAALMDETLAPPLRVSMEFQDANLKDVFKVFSQKTGINVIAGGKLGDQPVTLYLEDVTVMDALDQILHASQLTYERPAGSDIYIVKPKTAAEGKTATITRIYRIKYARVSKSVLAKAAAAFGARTPFEAEKASGSSKSGGSGGGGGSGSSAGGSGAVGGSGITVGIDEVVETLLTEEGSVTVDGRTNSLIVTDVPENFPRIEAALVALDTRTPQILVDAELIETSLSKLKDLGVEWGTGSEGELITLTPGSRTTRFPWSALGTIQDNLVPSSSSRFSATTLSAASFKGILQAIESNTDTKILARPKVLTLDNESAIIRLTADEAIGFSSSSQATTGTTTSEPERTTTGVVLVVTPQVNEDGYITMVIEPSVTKTVASRVTAPSGQATPRDPKTRSSRTLVRIKSGETLVVGGLIDRSDEDIVQRVPVLSGIPFLGEAFKNNEVSKTATELIVFVTPRILDEPTASQMAFDSQGPLGAREQEAPGARAESMEQTLNTLEQGQNL